MIICVAVPFVLSCSSVVRLRSREIFNSTTLICNLSVTAAISDAKQQRYQTLEVDKLVVPHYNKRAEYT